MNRLEEIKKRLHDVTTEQFNLGAEMDAEHEFNTNAQSDMAYLLSIIESVEQDLSNIANSKDVNFMNFVAEEALQVIRK